MADTAHRIGPMRRIKVTSRGVQDYNICEYSSISWISGEVLRLIRRISGASCGASGVKQVGSSR
jgi:hypothetical protein